MTRADTRHVAWIAPLAMAGAFWLKLRADRCLDNHFYNRLRALGWRDWDRELIPYGIETCDFWPTTAYYLLVYGGLAAFALLIGFLGGHFLREKPVNRSSWIASIAFLLPFGFSMWVYGPEYWSYGLDWGYGAIAAEVSLSLAIVLAAILTTTLGAWLGLRFRRRG